MNIRLLFLSFITILSFGCYEEPFYKLEVNVVNQSLVPIENAEVIISVQDEFGVIVDSANVYKSGFTNSNGNILFEFENLGFFTVESIKTFDNGSNQICGSASVGLEENTTKEITILNTESNCN
ncbi:MAG: hypothetical protein CBC73_01785 [Flavobacteriales bacterium TMED113]|nr:MAG: hypothetical protein CBC73_01785 [Flavobacteriales bacterium TMED113]